MNVFSIVVLLFLAGVVQLVSGALFNCDNYNSKVCTLDLIPFCLTNGTIIRGRCGAQRAVCVEQATIDETFSSCSQHSMSSFDCSKFNPILCARDAIAFCLTNGTIIRGSCFAKRAVCLEHQTVDEDFSSCNTANRMDKPTNFDCAGFNPMICAKDAIAFCLTNGTVVRGSCIAKKAVCLEHQAVDDNFSSCNKMKQANMSDDNDNNAATSIQVAFSLVLMALICTLF